MGFWNFLKEFSRKKEETKEIKFEELEEWVNSNLKEKFDNVDRKTTEIKKEFSAEKREIENGLNVLLTAELKNKDIPERAKQIMEGNRKTYNQKMKSFLSQIEFPEDNEKVLDFSDGFNSLLNNFEQNIGKNHHVVSEFFPKEGGAFLRRVRNLDGLVKEAKKIFEDSDIGKIKQLRNQFQDMKSAEEKKKKLEEKIIISQQEFDNIASLIGEKKNELKLIEDGEEYKNFMSLTKQKEDLEREIDKEKEKITGSFSSIESAFKKYTKINEADEMAVKYLKDPLGTLEHDQFFEILNILNKIENLVEAHGLDLKNKKREKTLMGLKKLNKELFQDFLIKKKELTVKLQGIELEISELKVKEQIDNLKEELGIDERELEGFKGRIEKLKKNFDGIDAGALEKKVRDFVEEEFGVRVV